MLDFDREMELENAGIDAFDFSLMDDDERREALNDAGLDPDDYETIEFDRSFDAWSKLQDAGLSLSDLSYRDEETAREKLRDAGLDPDDYDGVSRPSYRYYVPSRPTAPPPSAAAPQKPVPLTPPALSVPAPSAAVPAAYAHTATIPSVPGPSPVRAFCQVRFPGSETLYSYWADGLGLQPGDRVIVPVGDRGDRAVATVAVTGACAENDAPYPADRMKSAERLAKDGEDGRCPAKSEPKKSIPETPVPSGSPASPPQEAAGSFQTETDRKNEAVQKDEEEKEKQKKKQRLVRIVVAAVVGAAILGVLISIGVKESRERRIIEGYYNDGLAYYASQDYHNAYDSFNRAFVIDRQNIYGLRDNAYAYKRLSEAQYEYEEEDYWGSYLSSYQVVHNISCDQEIKKLAEEHMNRADRMHDVQTAAQKKEYEEEMERKREEARRIGPTIAEPYVGMDSFYVDYTRLGKHTSVTSREWQLNGNGEWIYANIYQFYSGKTLIMIVVCHDGKVVEIRDFRNKKPSSSSSGYSSYHYYDDDDADEYYADEFASAADFYEYYRDDFYDFEEAEDYYYEHGGW